MRVFRLPGTLLLAATVVSLASLSCSDRHDLATRPTMAVETPSTNAGGAAQARGAKPGFYPLATGNHWSYTQEVVMQLVGVPDPPPAAHGISFRNVEIGPPVTIEGREYLGEVTVNDGPGGPQPLYAAIRQDATGLYEWSPILPGEGGASPSPALRMAVPAGRSPAEHKALEIAARRLEEKIAALEASLGGRVGAGFAMSRPLARAPGEVTRLRYPLRPKLQWQIREDRRFNSSARVIGQEKLLLPPGPLNGYRIAIVS